MSREQGRCNSKGAMELKRCGEDPRGFKHHGLECQGHQNIKGVKVMGFDFRGIKVRGSNVNVNNGKVSGLVPVQVIPAGTKLVKGPGFRRPILVQEMPAVAKRRTLESNRKLSAVDEVVNEYLNYAQQSTATPFHRSQDAPFRCPCCAERNRQSLDRKSSWPIKNEHDSTADQSTTKVNPETNFQPSYHHHPTVNSLPISPLSSRWSRNTVVPYPWTFPDPEMKRPFYQQTVLEPFSRKAAAQRAYISRRVAEADCKYDSSMHRLRDQIRHHFVLPENAVYLGLDRKLSIKSDLS
ncbi:uncharacterized protein LOC131940596 [Physella acuta]|uniref:uncharacterized protein LOC131940596 n=1 Tax=Physella acuta TaxID=109671 RepID=UPI0027DD748B|nr:uncharacterized protein LOC131940596 [Physella acuta]